MKVRICTDSEWDDTKGTKVWLSTQFFCPELNKNAIYLNKSASQPVVERLQFHSNLKGFHLVFVDNIDESSLLQDFANYISPEITDVELVIYFSPRDIQYNLKQGYYLQLLKEKTLKQKRNIKGRFKVEKINVTVKDIYGLGSTGLKKLAESVGYTMSSKNEMDDYKSHMLDGLLELPELFISYAMGDVIDLNEIYDRFFNLVNDVRVNQLGIPAYKTIQEMPLTTGSIVAKSFEEWIMAQTSRQTALDFCFKKLGTVKMDTKRESNSRIYSNLIKKVKSEADIQTLSEEIKKLSKNKFENTGLGSCGIGYFAKIGYSTATFNALVQGGRCINEKPHQFVVEYGLDPDLNSCYGSALREFTYPIGLPTVIQYTSNQETKTLKQFLTTYSKELEDNLYQIVVEGKLSFNQDLLFSKVATQKEINKAYLEGFDGEGDFRDAQVRDEISKIPALFALLQQEVINAVITSDVLEVLKKVASNKELAEINNLKVVTATFYKKSDRLDTLDEWIDCVISDKGKEEFKNGVEYKDTRTKKWVGLKLESFIGSLISERKKLKADKENPMANAKQATLKLFINTLYGAVASPYFEIGNVVVANNITARARVGSWMMSKALSTSQVITDGGMYTPTAVCMWDASGAKPSFNTFADTENWVDVKRSDRRWYEPLAGKDWKKIISEADYSEIYQADNYAMNHISKFWSPYGLTLPFSIEHKIDNTFLRAAYHGKGNYALKLIKPLENGKDVLYRIRGTKYFEDESGLTMHPLYELFDNIIDGRETFPTQLNYNHKSLLKIGKYVTIQESNGYENLKESMPGDEIIENRRARFNNIFVPCKNLQELKKRMRRDNVVDGEKIPLFEKYSTLGYASILKRMMNDQLNLG